MKVKSESEVAQSCLTLSDPGSSVHGIFQARVLEWVAIAFSSGHCRDSKKTKQRIRPPKRKVEIIVTFFLLLHLKVLFR